MAVHDVLWVIRHHTDQFRQPAGSGQQDESQSRQSRLGLGPPCGPRSGKG